MNNPFRPQFGLKPKFFLERGAEEDEIISGLHKEYSPYHTTIISGVRGSGKTSLLDDVGAALLNEKDWLIINVSDGNKLLRNIVEETVNEVNKLNKGVFNYLSKLNISILGMSIGLDLQTSRQDYGFQVGMQNILEVLAKHHLKLLITIDEIRNSKSLEEFASAYQLFLRRKQPVYLVMAGLPKNVLSVLNNDVLTFLWRAKLIFLDNIDLPIVSETYRSLFAQRQTGFEAEALLYLTKLSLGYPYAYQLLGYYLWESCGADITVAAVKAIENKVKLDMYNKVIGIIYHKLTRIEKDFLMAIAQAGMVVKIATIITKLGKSKSYIANYTLRLKDAGLIKKVSHTELTFTIPFMREYLLEQQQIDNFAM